MNKLLVFQITLFLVFAGGFGYMMAYTDVYNDIKSTIVDKVCFSCIKMNPVTHLSFTFETVDNKPHPKFVLDNLTKGPVFLAFRADVCTACDEMDPILKNIFDVEFGKSELFYQTINYSGSNVSFFHINVDPGHSSGEFLDSFSIYDKDKRSGVPMFVIIALGNNDGTIQPYYATAYGTLSEKFLRDMISMGIDLYNQNILNYLN